MSRSRDLEPFIRLLIERGAYSAKVFDAAGIVAEDWVLDACRDGCPAYGACLMCPPHSPSPAETRKTVASFSRALLVTFRCESYERRPPMREILAEVEHAMKADGLPCALAYAMGPCDLCDPCPMDECLRPDVARPAMEACGIDVFATARNAGLDLRKANGPAEELDLCCLILAD